MDEEEFWRIIGENKPENYDAVYDLIAERIPEKEGRKFFLLSDKLINELYNPKVFASAYLIFAGALNEVGFYDFCSRIILSGKNSYEAALIDLSLLEESRIFEALEDVSFYGVFVAFSKVHSSDVDSSGNTGYTISDITFKGESGFDLLTRENCRELCPDLYNKHGELAFM